MYNQGDYTQKCDAIVEFYVSIIDFVPSFDLGLQENSVCVALLEVLQISFSEHDLVKSLDRTYAKEQMGCQGNNRVEQDSS
jgi:hypothetical protein